MMLMWPTGEMSLTPLLYALISEYIEKLNCVYISIKTGEMEVF